MHDFLIIGQGICGTFLSYYLVNEGASVVVIDNNKVNSASRVAAGVINPITGRRMVKVWMAEEVLPFAFSAYNEIGNRLGIPAISQKNIIDFFPNPFMRENFLKRKTENNEFLNLVSEENEFRNYFNFDFGCGEIVPVYLSHLDALIPAWRRELEKSGALIEDNFENGLLEVGSSEVRYGDIRAKKIIFCDGASGLNNSYFRDLPFAPNKGEALIVHIPGLPVNNIFKKSMLLAPMKDKDHFWVGSTYEWEFSNDLPTPDFRERTGRQLNEWLKLPFTIVDHVAAVRPATVERRPFVGLHPLHPNVGILNGMGTKGCSLAPFFAKQLAGHLLHGKPILKEASVDRFKGLLSRME